MLKGALIIGVTLLLVFVGDVTADVICQEEATCKTPTPTANMTIPTRTPDPTETQMPSTNTPDPPTPTVVETVPTRTPAPDTPTPTPETVLGTPWTSVPTETPWPTLTPLWTPVRMTPSPTKDRGNYQPHTPTPELVLFLPDTGDPWEEIVEVVVYDYATAWALGIGIVMGCGLALMFHRVYGGER